MSFLEKAKKLIVKEVWAEDDDGEDYLVSTDKTLVKYIRKPVEHLFRDIINEWHQVFPHVNETVVYPGCATDIIRCLLITKAKMLIGMDLVDPNFYPAILEAPGASEIVKNMNELVTISNVVAEEISLIRSCYEGALAEENAFRTLDITGNRLVMDFDLFGIPRHVVVYTGVDANTFVPPELRGKHIDVMFHNAYTVDRSTIQKLRPTYVLTPWKEFYDDIPSQIATFDLHFWSSEIWKLIVELGTILDTKDAKDPLILAKAIMLKTFIEKNVVEVHRLL
jgi:hypothetical protein